LHGIQSHGGWYLESARALCNAGWALSLLDRRGCGLNSIARGDCPSFRRLLDDVAEFIRAAPAATPTVVVGISWGGKLALALPRRHPGLCDGLVLIAPGVRPVRRPPLATRLHILAARLFRPTRLFPIPLNDPALFTDMPHRRRQIADDPLALRRATARLLVENVRLGVYVRVARRRITVPTLVLLASRDRIIDNRRTRRFFRKMAGPVHVQEYAGACHTLEFEPDGPPFVGDVARWLDRRFPATSR
jgi:alpha-beta hydrolase superfamily lysophospholipase